jgi:hypothetical protein
VIFLAPMVGIVVNTSSLANVYDFVGVRAHGLDVGGPS